MRIPDVYLSVRDLADAEIMALINRCKVIGCYIWVPLDDYSFLGRFSAMQDLYILKGDKIENLDFLCEMHECGMLYLQNARLQNLDIIFSLKKERKSLPGCFRCVALDNCQIRDLSVVWREKAYFSEFLVWNPASRKEKDRFTAVSAGIKRYYTFAD